MGNTQSNAYVQPLSVDLSDTQRAEVFKKEFVNDAVRHAKQSARRYANVVIGGLERNYGSTFDKSDMELLQVMATYGVHKELREYAGKVVRRLVSERLVR